MGRDWRNVGGPDVGNDKEWFVLLLIVLIMLVLVLWPRVGAHAAPLVDTSPLVSPLPTPDAERFPQLKGCTSACVVLVEGYGFACRAECMEDLGLEVPPCALYGLLTPTPPPTTEVLPTKTVTPTPQDEVLMDALWMGRCQAWYSEAQGRVTRISCP